MDVLVLQHIACEPPGVYEDVLLERGASLHRTELDEGDLWVRTQFPVGISIEAVRPYVREIRERLDSLNILSAAEVDRQQQLLRELTPSSLPAVWGSHGVTCTV